MMSRRLQFWMSTAVAAVIVTAVLAQQTYRSYQGASLWSEFHAYLRQSTAGAFTNQQFTVANPYEGATTLAVPGSLYQYRIYAIHIDTDRSVTVTIASNAGGTEVLWQHTIPAGTGSFVVPPLGIPCGYGKTLYLTTGTFIGTVRVFGALQG